MWLASKKKHHRKRDRVGKIAHLITAGEQEGKISWNVRLFKALPSDLHPPSRTYLKRALCPLQCVNNLWVILMLSFSIIYVGISQ